MVSKKDFIIKAFSEMNVSLLEVTLDEDIKYPLNLTKDEFIVKISGVFDEFKKAQDIILTPFTGKCTADNCSNNDGQCVGFSFVGKHSKNGIDLVFRETDNNFISIQKCYSFKIDKKGVKSYSLFIDKHFFELRI